MKLRCIYLLLISLASFSVIGQQDSSANEDPTGMTMEQFNLRINSTTKPVLVYFTAGWCVVCKREKPILSQVKQETAEALEFLNLDMESNPLIAEHFEVDSLPSFILYQDGHLIWNSVGFQDKEMLMRQIRPLLKK